MEIKPTTGNKLRCTKGLEKAQTVAETGLFIFAAKQILKQPHAPSAQRVHRAQPPYPQTTQAILLPLKAVYQEPIGVYTIAGRVDRKTGRRD